MQVGGGGEMSAMASPSPLTKKLAQAAMIYQYYLDKTTPHAVPRWIGTLVFAAIYGLRIFNVQGFYVVTYAVGIYILNLLIGFLSPLADPELEVSDGAMLPTKGSDEFKPFIRRLPEFKFWCVSATSCFTVHIVGSGPYCPYIGVSADIVFHGSVVCGRLSVMKAFCIAFICTFFSAFDVPVFWPILLCYWLVLLFLTMKRQIAHMIKYRYIPFNLGKQKYGGKKPSGGSSRGD